MKRVFKKILFEIGKSLNRRQFKYSQELLWANTYYDSIRGKKWLEDMPLNIGRWAGNYALFYILNRVLSDYKPKNIIEFGLGESSKFISGFLENSLSDSEHKIIEHSDEWKNSFLSRNELSNRSRVEVLPIFQRKVNSVMVKSYKNIEKLINNKYDLYLIDGPFASKRYSRYDICILSENFKKNDEFIIIMDDYNRKGEQETFSQLQNILTSKKIKFKVGKYSGVQDVAVLATEKYKFATSL